MDELPKPTLDQALGDLRPRPNFHVVLQALYNEREALFSELEVAGKDDVMKVAGRIAQADKTIYLLTASNEPMPRGVNGWITVQPPKWLRWLFKRYIV